MRGSVRSQGLNRMRSGRGQNSYGLQLCNKDGRMLLLLYSLIVCAVSQGRRYILPKRPRAAQAALAQPAKRERRLPLLGYAGKGGVCEEKAAPVMVWQIL